jgi:hypothetical protein
MSIFHMTLDEIAEYIDQQAEILETLYYTDPNGKPQRVAERLRTLAYKLREPSANGEATC